MSDNKEGLEYWKNNAEEDYLHTPISVLRYITELEEALNKGTHFDLNSTGFLDEEISKYKDIPTVFVDKDPNGDEGLDGGEDITFLGDYKKNVEVLSNETTYLISGKTKDLGKYINILDIRPEYDGEDNDSETDDYLVEWSEKLGFLRNDLSIKENELRNKSIIIDLVEKNFETKI